MKYTLNIFKKLTILSIFIFSIISCSEDDVIDSLNTLKVAHFLEVSYGSAQLQNYAIYLPKDRTITDTKVLILVHGGSWVGGDKSDLNPFVESLKTTFPHYAIVNINYQLATIGKSPFPMQINDIKKLISHLKSNSDEYQISNNYGFIGTSAGAHLSMLYTYAFDNSNDVKMVCSIVGPTNFTDENYTKNPDFIEVSQGIQLITGVNYETNPTYYEEVSPYHVVTSEAPPTILFYGGKDELIPTSQGVDLHAKLDELNVINEFTLYENEGHGWQGQALNDTYQKLEMFISTYF